jgi:glycosyltransferase involved in cell wall biosynthesis
MKSGYIPKDQRKTILLLSDDFRMPSGVGVMSREIVLGTAHKYNWIQVGAAVQHPDAGKIFDMSQAVNNETGLTDSYVKIIPYNGYGDANLLRTIIQMEHPDAILHFTDPRYWIWLYEIEHEIRELMPLMFYHVWDDLPFPKYNYSYYRSCDFIANISRQTYNIVKNVAPELEPWQVSYVPHGINEKQFFKIEDSAQLPELAEFRKKLFRNDDVEFAVLYNNRNIRRKMTGDVVLAFQKFFASLSPEEKTKVRLVLHTQRVDENGTDLPALIRDVAPEIPVVFSEQRVETKYLNMLYNCCDTVINLASNEGFGLGTAEALMAELPIIVNVTGGLQDQCGFKNEVGEYLHEDREYNAQWGSNHDGKYRAHGEWAFPVFPAQRALIGSPPTPYIFDDRCKWEDAADEIRKLYDMGKEERERRGKLGREYMLQEGFNAIEMCNRFIDNIETACTKWIPRKRFTLVKG